MGAFDGELYALGYRFYAPREEKETYVDIFVGPHWEGNCMGDCSAEVCRPCPSNNRLSHKKLIKVYEIKKKWEIDLVQFPGLKNKKEREDASFIKKYPSYKAWLESSNFREDE
jgi:hypothetical protein